MWADILPGTLVFAHLSHPERGLINLVDGHERLHVVKQEHIVEDGGEKGQRAVQHSSREDTLPVAPDAPSHSSQSLCFVQSSHGLADHGSPPHCGLKNTEQFEKVIFSPADKVLLEVTAASHGYISE